MWRAFERLYYFTMALSFDNSHKHCGGRSLEWVFDFRHRQRPASLLHIVELYASIYDGRLRQNPVQDKLRFDSKSITTYGVVLLMHDLINILFGPELATTLLEVSNNAGQELIGSRNRLAARIG
jgi:hypothetical protein